MASKSSVRKLPDELRVEIDRLLRDGKFTLVQITEHMRALGADISKSAVHRYSQDFERMTEDIRLTREMARAVGRELKDDVEGNATQMLVESMHALLLKARMQVSDSGDIDAGAVSDLCKAVKDLQVASKSSVEMRLKMRAEAAREAAAVVDDVVTKQGLSADTVQAIKERILGIGKKP
jgi:hypothetical protein